MLNGLLFLFLGGMATSMTLVEGNKKGKILPISGFKQQVTATYVLSLPKTTLLFLLFSVVSLFALKIEDEKLSLGTTLIAFALLNSMYLLLLLSKELALIAVQN